MKLITSTIIALVISAAPMLAQQRDDRPQNESPRIEAGSKFASLNCAQSGLQDCGSVVKLIRVSDDSSNAPLPRIKRMPWMIGAFQ